MRILGSVDRPAALPPGPTPESSAPLPPGEANVTASARERGATGPNPDPSRQLREEPWRIALLAGLVYMLGAADLAIMSLALPAMARSFPDALHRLPWIISTFALASSSFLIAGGRLGDIFGARRALLLGLLLLAGGTLAGGSATDFPIILVGRFVQGLGGAILSPVAFSLLHGMVSEEDRPRALGRFAVLQGAGALGGPILGGLAIAQFGWRAAFLITLPVLALLLWLIAPLRTSRRQLVGQQAFDWRGLLFVNIGVTAIILATTTGDPRLRFGAIAAAMGLLPAFLWWQMRAPDPLVPLELVRRSPFRLGMIASAVLIASGASFVILASLSMQMRLHFNAAQAGFGMLPFALGTLAAGQLSPLILRRWRPPLIMGVALAIILLGVLISALLVPIDDYAISVAPGLVCVAAGLILCYLAMMSYALEGVEKSRQAGASGILLTLQQLAAATGTAAILAAFGHANMTVVREIKIFELAYGAITILVSIGLAATVLTAHSEPRKAHASLKGRNDRPSHPSPEGGDDPRSMA